MDEVVDDFVDIKTRIESALKWCGENIPGVDEMSVDLIDYRDEKEFGEGRWVTMWDLKAPRRLLINLQEMSSFTDAQLRYTMAHMMLMREYLDWAVSKESKESANAAACGVINRYLASYATEDFSVPDGDLFTAKSDDVDREYQRMCEVLEIAKLHMDCQSDANERDEQPAIGP